LDFGPGYRIYYIKMNNKVIVLMCGGDKSSQSKDIQFAYAIAARLKEKYEQQ